MARWFGLVVVLLVSTLLAETQQEAYYRAMKAEEAGDIPAALKAFEEAVALPGPYTEELQGIINDYHEALGTSNIDSVSPWKFHVAGELGLFGMHYKETGMDDGELGGDIFLNVNPYWEYLSGAWSHMFAASVQGDFFLNNDNMTILDTNDWNLSLGLQYELTGKSMILDAGYDFNIEGREISSDFYAWFEKHFYRSEKQRVGAVAWAHYRTSGPMSYALYGAWHRLVPEGLNASVYVGAKFDADSVFDYKSYWNSYKALLQSYQDSVNAVYGSPEYAFAESDATETEATSTESAEKDLVIRYALGSWLGPVILSKVSYKFKNQISVEGRMNLFYGIAIGGPGETFKKLKKLNGTVSLTAMWTHWKMSYYLGLVRNFKYYSSPELYKNVYKERSALTQLKLGVKWDI